jgi:hypothetical protein
LFYVNIIRELKTFTLLPEFAVQCLHIPICTTSLYYLYKAIEFGGLPGGPQPTLKVFRESANDWWYNALRLKSVTTSNRIFAYSVETDGVAVSVFLQKPRAQGESLPNNLNLEGKAVWGLDPGRKDLFVAAKQVQVQENEMPKRDRIVSCSTKEYYHLAGFTYASKKRELWVRKAPAIQEINQRMPTSKCSTAAEYESYLAFALASLSALLEFYGERRWRRLRFKSYIGRQQAMELLCRRIVPKNQRRENVVVAFGSAQFPWGRGHASGPVKAFRKELARRCHVVMVDEYLTSRVCSTCQGLFDDHQWFWSLRICKNICLTRWNRDVNAARNIRNILIHMAENQGERPDPFRRPGRHPNLTTAPLISRASCRPSERME